MITRNHTASPTAHTYPAAGECAPRPSEYSMSPERAQAALNAPNVITPCRRDPARWDIDRTRTPGLRAAARACRLACPLYHACCIVARSGTVSLRSMVWAGIVYDERGNIAPLNSPKLRFGHGSADTRIPDDWGRLYNGHTGRWELPAET